MTAEDSGLPMPLPPPNSTARDDGLWVERTGTGSYRGHNARGGVVDIGPLTSDNAFSPTELMKLALAGCTGMSCDTALGRRLGDKVRVEVHVAGPLDPTERRFPALSEELVVDLSSLSDAESDKVRVIVRRAIEKYCRVRRTLARGADISLVLTSPAPTPPGIHDRTTDAC